MIYAHLIEYPYLRKLMKKSIFLLHIAFILLADLLSAQSITVAPAQLNFGVVTETAPDSQQVTITNNTGYDVTLTGYRFYTIYGNSPFSTSAGNITIPNGNSQSIWIKFSPRHNIAHNTELFILNSGHQGALRVDLLGQGHYSKTYYNHTENLKEEVLKDTLQGIISNNYVNLGYSTGRDSMFMIIDNKKVNGQGASQNTIECVYTGRNAVGYIDRTDCQTNFTFNTEHTFPQGFFNSLEPMRADLYHLYPTDDLANNVRGSLPFGTVTNPSWTSGGSKCNNTTFEPRDVHKGHVARAMLYFVIRYQNYNNFLNSQEGILRQWHRTFLPDPIEITRAEKIFTMQDNRNPFIDYPQFEERITSFSSTSVEGAFASSDTPEDTINFGLVNATIPARYTFWVANDGNQVLTMYNMNLTPSTLLSFLNGTGTGTTIQPGEAVPIDIELANAAPGTLQNAFLNFALSGNGLLANIVVPIEAQLSLTGTEEIPNAYAYTLYPNPATTELCIDGSDGIKSNLRIMDMSGRTISTLTGMSNNCYDIRDIQSPGIYILQWEEQSAVIRKTWIKQ